MIGNIISAELEKMFEENYYQKRSALIEFQGMRGAAFQLGENSHDQNAMRYGTGMVT